MTTENTLEKIRKYAVRKKLSRWKLALEAGLSHMTLRNMDKPDWSPTVNTLRKLETYMADNR